MAEVNIPGIVGIVVFYLLILAVGIWASRRRKAGEEEAMLAGRSIGTYVGIFTLTGKALLTVKVKVKSNYWSIIILIYLKWYKY